MKWIKCTDQLPPEGKIVLLRYNGGNWIYPNDQQGWNCVTGYLRKGLSLADRVAMKNGKLPNPLTGSTDPMTKHCRMSDVWRTEDEGSGNNIPPYAWCLHNMTLFGQDVDCWMEFELPL